MDGALPKTTFEQRAPLYEDVEALISPGFLTHNITASSVQLAIRSLGPGDLFLLRSRLGYGSDNDWQSWALASAIWMVDGIVLLGTPNVPVRLVQLLRGLPVGAREKLFSVLSVLFDRQTRATQAVEAFCYEATSRFLWKTHGGHHPASQAGVPGIESLGTNNIQRMWTFFNEVEDQRVKDETLWEGFKLSASAQSPKGVKKIDQRDKQLHQQELDRRRALQDRFYYLAKGLIKPDGTTKDGKPIPKLRGKSADELADEMYRWVTGQEDEHDRIVNEYKHRVVQRYENEKKAREARLRQLRAQQDREGLLDQPLPLVGYTPEQLQDLLKGRGIGPPGVKTIHEGPQGSQEYLYNKYLEKAPDSGALKPQGGKLIPVQEGADLTEALAARRVPFRTEETES